MGLRVCQLSSKWEGYREASLLSKAVKAMHLCLCACARVCVCVCVCVRVCVCGTNVGKPVLALLGRKGAGC